MSRFYDDFLYECEGPTCELLRELVVSFIFYAIIAAVILKLLRADKLAGFTFNAAFAVPMFLGLGGAMIFLPVGLIYSLFYYFNIFSEYRWVVSIITVALIASIIFIDHYRSSRTSDSIAWWDLKAQYQLRFNSYWSSAQFKNRNRSNEQHLSELDAEIDLEIKNRGGYQFLAFGFSIFVYFLCRDFQSTQFFYDFLNDDIAAFIKYPLLFVSLALVLYCYTKYYNIIAQNQFNKMMSLINILEKEKKYVFLTGGRGYIFKISAKEPQRTRGYYHFDLLDDGTVAYRISSCCDYKKYLGVKKKIRELGVQGFLDEVAAAVEETKNRK